MRRLLATGAAVAVAGMLASGATAAQPGLGVGVRPSSATPGADTVAASDAPVEVAPDLAAGPVDTVNGRVTRTSPAAARISPAGSNSIPPVASTAYQRAAQVMVASSPACRLPWTLLAAIGRVESDHGQSSGARLDADGVAKPAILGRRLDGHGVARIPDTDGGRLDRDTTWDRAVGPMQLIPSTWLAVAVDGDGDGVRNPEDIDDAALGAAVFLCAGGGDLSTPAGASAAIFRYNASKRYVDVVLAYQRAYAADANRPVDVVQLPSSGPGVPVDARELPTAKPHRPHAKPKAPSSKPTKTPTHATASGPTATHTQPAKPKPTPPPPPPPQEKPWPTDQTPQQLTVTWKVHDGGWQVDDGTHTIAVAPFTDVDLDKPAAADYDGVNGVQSLREELNGLDNGKPIKVTIKRNGKDAAVVSEIAGVAIANAAPEDEPSQASDSATPDAKSTG